MNSFIFVAGFNFIIMEEQKYFTPNVEDFHKGYEYEILELHRENYHVGFNNIISKWIPKNGIHPKLD